MTAATVFEGDLRNVEIPDRVDRGEHLGSFDAVDESPFSIEFCALRELVADLGSVGRSVDGLDPAGAKRDRTGVIETALDLDPVRTKNRFALFREVFDRLFREPVPDFELSGVGSDRRIHGIGIWQRPIP